MKNEDMLTAISRLQAMGIAVGQDRDDAYGLYWQAADLGWALMQARGIAAVTREEFVAKQEEMFELAWSFTSQFKRQGNLPLEDSWPDVIE